VRSQTEQLRSWQVEMEAALKPAPGAVERARAAWNLREQAVLRRVAYRVLKLRRSFQSTPTG
jgi:hypothetical protein